MTGKHEKSYANSLPFDVRRVLIIDDNVEFAETLSDLLEINDYECAIAQNTQDITKILQTFQPQVALIDIRLEDENGINLISKIKKQLPQTLCVMITAYVQIETAVKALKNGAYDYLRKPISGDELLATLERCYEILRLEYEKEQAEEILKTRNKELEESNNRLRKIVESTWKITSCSLLPEFGAILLKEFAENMKAQGGSFFLKKNGVFMLVHALDPGHAPKVLKLPLRKGSVFERLINDMKPILIANIKDKESLMQSGWQGYKSDSLLAFPLFDVSGNIAGIISLHDKKKPPFTTQDLDFGSLIASYTSESLHAVTVTENLFLSEERYRRLLETMNDGLIVLDENFRLTYANDKFCKIVGYSRSELLNQALFSIMDEATQTQFCKCITKDNHGGDKVFEVIWERKDGAQRTTLVSPQIIPDTECKSNSCFAVVTDITKRKKAEEELKEQKRESDIRIKELNCLCSISGMLNKPNVSFDEIFKKTIKIIPQAFQFPHIACAKITINEQDYLTSECLNSPTCDISLLLKTSSILRRDIVAYGKNIGTINVWYREKTQAGADYMFLREERSIVNAVAELLGSIIERKNAEDDLKTSLDKLKTAMEGIIQAMAMTAEMRDPYTAGHQRRVSKLASNIAKEMGLLAKEIECIRLAGIIHDIGKIYVPAEILSKPGVISDIEFGIIKTHPQVGHDILNTIEFPWPLAKIVHQHHERLDGSGYPLGISGDDIMLAARILSVADTVEAMASHRPYRPALGIEKALEEINQNAGILYDSEVVDICTGLFIKKGFEFE